MDHNMVYFNGKISWLHFIINVYLCHEAIPQKPKIFQAGKWPHLDGQNKVLRVCPRNEMANQFK